MSRPRLWRIVSADVTVTVENPVVAFVLFRAMVENEPKRTWRLYDHKGTQVMAVVPGSA